MSESSIPDSASPKPPKSLWRFGFYISVLVPVAAAMILYQLEPFETASLPNHELSRQVMVAPRRNSRMLKGSDAIGLAQLLGPEDIIYDHKSKLIYTGCVDGWIKQVTLNDSAAGTVVKNWAHVGGRPLGLAFGHYNNIIVGDADNGLLNVTENGVVELLTNEAHGIPFKLTDGVDVAEDGMIYFTDASYKYSLKDFIWDVLEGKPHGRLMSYDPSTKKTKVLVHHLYFANGVAVSPDQTHVVFCESVMRRCRKYHIRGDRKGHIDHFTNHLPGLPDNIHYDGDGHYLIALATAITYPWDLALKYASVRKIVAIMEKYVGRPHMEKSGGVLVVDLEGNPIAHYYDIGLAFVSSGIKVGDHLYCGSLVLPYIIRLNVTQHPAQAIM